MNTDKTLRDKFCDIKEYPIWYYKKIIDVDIDYVIENLILQDIFIVEIDSIKYEITFGKNKKGMIGRNIIYSDYHKPKETLSSELINNAFKKGIWYIPSEEDTSDEFKLEFNKNKEKYEKENLKIHMKNYLEELTKLAYTNEKEYQEKIQLLNSLSYEELYSLWEQITSNWGKNN